MKHDSLYSAVKTADAILNNDSHYNYYNPVHSILFKGKTYKMNEIDEKTFVKKINSKKLEFSDVNSFLTKIYSVEEEGSLFFIKEEEALSAVLVKLIGSSYIKEITIRPIVSLFRTDENSIDFDKLVEILTADGTCGIVNLTLKTWYMLPINRHILNCILIGNKYRLSGEQPYKKFKLTCKNGKVRDIIAPKEDIKKELQEVNKLLQVAYDDKNSNFQVGYKKGKSIRDNAKIHKSKQYIFNIDLHDFFPSCKRGLVEKKIDFLFDKYFDPVGKLKNEFLDLILDNDALFIGSPVSGTLANAIIAAPVAYIKNISKKYDVNFSVYADDMSFSSDRYLSKKFIIGMFKEAFAKYELLDYFSLSEKKCKGGSRTNRKVTGLGFNEADQVVPKRKFYNDIRLGLHHLRYGNFTWPYNKFKGILEFAVSTDESDKTKKLIKKYKKEIIENGYMKEDRLNELIKDI